jgi:cytochrome c peroxidase
MKKLFIPGILAAALLLLSYTQKEVGMPVLATHCAVVDSLLPNLPQIPFDYDVFVPAHADSFFFQNPQWLNDQITPWGATLGRVLFYDRRLSADNSVSCSSCHKQAHSFADNQPFSTGINGATTKRNSPNLNDLVWTGSPNLFWDVRPMELEEMVLLPIQHEGEMGKEIHTLITKLKNAPFYSFLFLKAFGSTEINEERIGLALKQFLTAMTTFNSRYDKVMSGDSEFTESEKSGRNLFVSKCSGCHRSGGFHNYYETNNGLGIDPDDMGKASWSNNEDHIGKFRSPSLKNIALTAPYMHDGRFQTLEEVIQFYSEGIQPTPNADLWEGFHFNAQQKADLLAFLQMLSDETFTKDVRFSDPFAEPVADNMVLLTERVSIFPNPANDLVSLVLESATGETYELRLTTTEGRVLKTQKTTEKSVQIVKGDLPAGVYFLEIRKGHQKRIEQIVFY